MQQTPLSYGLGGHFRDHSLVLVTGKGGVGKTTVSALVSRALAREGRRTLMVEIDPRESAHHLLGVPPTGGEEVPVRGHLYLQNLTPRRVLDAVVEERVKLGFVVKRIQESPVYHHFTEGCPGLEELAVLGHALRRVRHPGLGPRFDTVVIDAPASGHGVSLLRAPRLVSEVISGGPFGAMARELADFVGDPSQCAVVVVATAEEMPVQESLELMEILRTDLDREPALMAVNRLYPPCPEDFAPEDRLGRLWLERRRLNERELCRLGERWRGPALALPLLPLGRDEGILEALEKSGSLQEDLDRC